jgi:hypothetical protein
LWSLSRRSVRNAQAVLKNFARRPEKTFSTVSANNRHQPMGIPPKRVWHCCLIRRTISYGGDLRAMPREPLSRVERRLERVRFSWTSGKRAVASALAIADSWAYEHGKLNLRRALTAPANASEGADLRATSPARRCLASRLYGIRADDLLRRARIRRRRDDPCRCRRC